MIEFLIIGVIIFNYCYEWYKTFFDKIEECFICCSIDGKNEKELLLETFNTKTMNYPLLSLSDVYNCNCKKKYAHNKCLLNINKCPMCRKESYAKLYVQTKYDYYLKYLLNWLKKDNSNIHKLNCHMIYSIIFGSIILSICATYEDVICQIIPPKSIISLCFAIIITLSIFIPLYIFTILNDYIMKYWLYNIDTKKYDVFNNN